MISSYLFSILLASIAVIGFALYITIYIVLSWRVKRLEGELLDLFIKKTSKIPALIEVMRPYVDKSESFSPIIRVHTEVMIEELQSIYDILSHNAQIQSNFLFLMQLSVHVPWLQKDEYFLYIRDFIIDYEKRMGRLSDIFFPVNINKSYDSRFFLMILKYIKIPQIIRGIL